MSGMGKPQDGQTWIFQESTDSWVSGSAGSGGADNFSTQSIITRMSGSNASRIDRIDSVRLSGSISGTILWQHDLAEYDSIDVRGTVIAFANSSSLSDERYARQTLAGTYYRLTGSVALVGSEIGLRRFSNNALFSVLPSAIVSTGSIVRLEVGQSVGITDWMSDFQIKRLITDETSDPGQLAGPADVTSLWAWYSASDSDLYQDPGRTTLATANADPVGSWSDLSGNNRHVYSTDNTFRPTINSSKASFNSKQVLTFDGSNDRLICDTSLVHPYTIFIVVETNSFPNSRWIAGRATNWLMGLQGSTSLQYFANAFAGTTTITAGTPLIHMVSQISTTGTHWRNGVAISGNINNPISVGTWSISDAQYGQVVNGSIAEVIIYNKTLATDERKIVEAYLGTRYGITVP
jgi:hypothetical protein